MAYKRLFIWVEGEYDVKFFEWIIKPILKEKYNCVKLIQYANESPKWRTNFLRSITAMNADYIYVADINQTPCVTAKKQKIQDEVKNIDNDRIIVVIKEIESWYLAGLDDTNTKKLEIRTHLITTDNITKEQFNSLMPEKFDSKIDFMLEILRCFSLEIARQKNSSFNYFAEKYIQCVR